MRDSVPEGVSRRRRDPQAEPVQAVVSGSRSGAYFCEPEGTDELWTLAGTDDIPVLPGDRVKVVATRSFLRDRRVAEVVEIVSRASDTVVCRWSSESPKEGWACAVPVDPFANTLCYVRGEKKDLEGRAFTVRLADRPISLWGANYLQGTVERVLGDLDDPDAELAVAVERFSIPHEFSEAALAQAAALPDEPPEEEAKERVDLRDLSFMTIDGEDARDFDDALWAAREGEGWRLLVAIADVSHYVTPGTPLDDDAQKRLTSVYFPRRVVPMLPEKLSNGLCSLNPGVDRCAMVCDMRVNAHGEVIAYQFYPALIRSHARQTYTAVWSALTGDDSDYRRRGGDRADLDVLYSLYQALRAARVRRGALDFETVETEVVCDEKTGRIADIRRRDHNDAHRLVEECMLAANVCAADFTGRRSALCLYRVHAAPSADRLEMLRATLSAFDLTLGGGDRPQAHDFEKVLSAVKDEPWAAAVQTAVLRSMQQAVYSPDNIGHYGLHYDHYTHFTSPIRRYPDLLVHRTIRLLLRRRKYQPQLAAGDDALMESRAGRLLVRRREAEQKADPSPSARRPGYANWVQLGLRSSAAERRADEASRDVLAWLKCMFLAPQTGKTFEGVISGVTPGGFFVTLQQLYVDGFLPLAKLGSEYFVFDPATNSVYGESSGKHWRIGDRLRVRVESVDPDAREVLFSSERRNEPARRSRFAPFSEDDGRPSRRQPQARRTAPRRRNAQRNRK